MVLTEKVENAYDKEELKRMIEAHVAHTGSAKGKRILEEFETWLPRFKKIIPGDYKRLLQLSARFEEQGMSAQEAMTAAFYAEIAGK